MKNIFFLFLFLTQISLAQDTKVFFKSDSSMYTYVLSRFIEETECKNSIWLEWNDLYSGKLPKVMKGVRVNWVYPIDFLKYIKKRSLKKIVVIRPISFYDGYFHVSACTFQIKYSKRKKLLTLTNEGGIGLIMTFDCIKNEYVVLKEFDGI
jgi:hypothetical protein